MFFRCKHADSECPSEVAFISQSDGDDKKLKLLKDFLESTQESRDPVETILAALGVKVPAPVMPEAQTAPQVVTQDPEPITYESEA